MSDGDQGRFVYVIGGQTGAQKIGISAAPAQRLATMQLYSPIKLAVHHHTSPSEVAPLVERVAHKLLEEKRLHGEWFDVPIEDAVAAVERAIELVDAGDLSILSVAEDPRVILPMPRELLKAVDDFRFDNRFDSRAEAIRQLLQLGLDASAKNAPPKRQARRPA